MRKLKKTTFIVFVFLSQSRFYPSSYLNSSTLRSIHFPKGHIWDSLLRRFFRFYICINQFWVNDVEQRREWKRENHVYKIPLGSINKSILYTERDSIHMSSFIVFLIFPFSFLSRNLDKSNSETVIGLYGDLTFPLWKRNLLFDLYPPGNTDVTHFNGVCLCALRHLPNLGKVSKSVQKELGRIYQAGSDVVCCKLIHTSMQIHTELSLL
jgi:hypothetical protein